ncbi:methylated-DNA--[protein]-cysteine S-methyltransferase [Diaphorobacter sp.]|uniref:methylated-DNA--[protein]-cysteine S-methyltransferase n=1 Tax=Diaphorobacter sp. TaxID=1934310 RepID=UPI0025900B50|nr:methylated-DNA--[protein]-cysteine S-methyltransferase [Diaphorobacter sp.]
MQYPRDTVQSRIATALGDVRLAASAKGLVGLWFDGQRHQPAQLDAAPAWPTDHAHPVLRAAAQQLQQFLRGERTRFDLPLDLSGGTPFQEAVWQALLAVPHGATTSYGALARQIGRPTAVRAVGAAVGRNPLSVVVPCHRAVGSAGALTGYAGGLPRKKALLALESGPQARAIPFTPLLNFA